MGRLGTSRLTARVRGGMLVSARYWPPTWKLPSSRMRRGGEGGGGEAGERVPAAAAPGKEGELVMLGSVVQYTCGAVEGSWKAASARCAARSGCCCRAVHSLTTVTTWTMADWLAVAEEPIRLPIQSVCGSSCSLALQPSAPLATVGVTLPLLWSQGAEILCAVCSVPLQRFLRCLFFHLAAAFPLGPSSSTCSSLR